eukprot:TRINITY_DN42_c0_g1_i1.p1 TRINITY_DN42_c0_g1~~TRINITY_DN42_c0_g1_i1.p1  ORF type:complete len:101 (+),score=13.82 TRINITY_DN42_c0_g1_i1:232-534(+)
MLHFLKWGLSCGFSSKELIPPSENTLMLYATWMARSLAPATISANVRARDLQEKAAFKDFKEEFKEMKTLEIAMQSIRKTHYSRTGKNKKAAIEPFGTLR